MERIRRRSKRGPLLFLGLGLAAALLLMPFPPSWRGLWQAKLQDLGHLPLFAALTWLLWACLGPPLHRPVLIAISLAGVAEVVQGWVGRTAGWHDFLCGALAALATGAVLAAWQRRRYPLRVVAWLVLGGAFLAWPLLDCVPYLVDAYQGSRAFPVLADFRTRRQLLRWRCRQADLSRVESHPPGTWVGRLEFAPGPHPYSYGAIRPILRDFRDYRWLCYSFSVEGKPLELVISLRSGPGEEGQTTHYQQQRTYPPGVYRERLDLKRIAPLADPLPLDLSDLWIIQFFLVRPQEPRTLILHRIWLEK